MRPRKSKKRFMIWALRHKFRLAAAAILIVSVFDACATRLALRPATAEESVRLLEAWELYRQAAVARGPMELFYEAQVSNRFLAVSGSLAVSYTHLTLPTNYS